MSVALATPLGLESIGDYITSTTWAMEQKLDGHRIVLVGKPDGVAVLSRSGEPYSKKIPAGVQSIQLPEGIVLDGELVGEDYWVFDLLQTIGDGFGSGMLLRERRELLESFASLLRINVIPQARTPEEKQALASYAIRHNLEGVILKSLDSTYQAGRSGKWFKIKFTPTADLVITGMGEDGKESATLSVIRNGKTHEVGRCSLIGKPPVSVGDVVEVKYLYVTEGGRLYQPTLNRVRFDKVPADCDGTDFRIVNKEVLVSTMSWTI